MKKIYKTIFKITFLTLLVGVLTIVTIVLFPTHLFASKLNYKNFTVCSNNTIDNHIKALLDNATALVKSSELYDSNYKYNIVLCYNTLYNKVDDQLLGPGPSARTTFGNIVIKVSINAEANVAFPTFHKACEVNLAALAAHEMIHCLQARKYGLSRFNPFNHPPFWKLEGYAEYVSKQGTLSGKDYSFKKDIDTFVRLRNMANDIWIKESNCEVPGYYYKGKLMMKYLIDIRHLTYDQILKDTTAENIVFDAMIKYNDRVEDIKTYGVFYL